MNKNSYRIGIKNYIENYGDYFADDYQGHRTKFVITSSNANVVKVTGNLDYVGVLANITLEPVSTGNATVTITLYEVELDGTVTKQLDEIVLAVTINEHKSNVILKEGEYNPAEDGYRQLVGEWQCGDNAYASVWWNGIEKENKGGRAVLLVTGEGDMWTTQEDYGDAETYPWGSIALNTLIKEVHVCEGITSVGSWTGGMATEAVYLPSTLKRIEESAFHKAQITELSLPDAVEYIGDKAFFCCDKLDAIVLPIRLKYLGMGAFYKSWTYGYDDHIYVREIVIPDTLEYIGSGAFSYRWGNTFVITEGHDRSRWDEEWFSFDGYEPRIEYR